MSDTGGSQAAGMYGPAFSDTTSEAGMYGPAYADTYTAPATQTPSSQGSTHNYGQAMTLVGGTMAAYGEYEAGKENQATARWNAEQARIQATQAIQAGDYAISEREARERYIEGGTRASFAGQGVVVGAGTSAAVLRNEANVSAMDKMMIGLNARRQAYGHQVMAIDQERRGDAAMRKGEMEAASTLLSTGKEYRKEGLSSSRYSDGDI